MGILLQFKSLFHDQSYLAVIVIHDQLFSFKFNAFGTRNSVRIPLPTSSLPPPYPLPTPHKEHIKCIKTQIIEQKQKRQRFYALKKHLRGRKSLV